MVSPYLRLNSARPRLLVWTVALYSWIRPSSSSYSMVLSRSFAHSSALRENSGLGTDYTVPTYRQWTEREYEDAAEKFYNDDTAGKTFDAATGEEVLETIGGADGPTAVITTTLG